MGETTTDQLLSVWYFKVCGLLGAPVTAMLRARGGRGGRQEMEGWERRKGAVQNKDMQVAEN